MNVFANVVIWGVVAGVALGVVLHYAIPVEFRPIVERVCLRVGAFGVLSEMVVLAITRGRVSEGVITPIGIMLVTFLVAGIWLFIASKRRSGVYNAFERTVRHCGPRLAAARSSWPAAQRDR